MLWGALALLVLFFATMPVSGARHARLAKTRPSIDEAGFLRVMDRGAISSTTARFLWQSLAPHYHAPLTPRPDDKLESLIGVDRPEIDGLINHFWTTMRGSDAFPRRAPLGPDPTVAELARYLDSIAGWTVMRAA